MNHKYVITGGPGGGKTTLLNALAASGYCVMPESARQIIKQRLAAGLSRRPEPVTFARQILSADIKTYQDASSRDYPVFFDRGIPDALCMLAAQNALTSDEIKKYMQEFAYSKTVFVLPPWSEIYTTDTERDQTFEESIAVFETMKAWYSQWGYETLEVPRGSINERLSYILHALAC